MEWGRFLRAIGSVFATAGLTVLMIFQYVLESAAPEFVKTSFGLGIGVMLLGSLIIYAVPKEK